LSAELTKLKRTHLDCFWRFFLLGWERGFNRSFTVYISVGNLCGPGSWKSRWRCTELHSNQSSWFI